MRHRASCLLALLTSVTPFVLGTTSFADVTLTSPDGRWVATIENEGGGAGQCTSLKDTSLAPQYQSFLGGTNHYVRIGSNDTFEASLTQRVDQLFSLVRFVAEGDNFTAILAANDVSGTVLMVNGEMANGPSGGLRVALTFMDSEPPPSGRFQSLLKPFVLVDLDVDGQPGADFGGWTTGPTNGHFWQKRQGSPAGSERWYVGVGPDAVQSASAVWLRSALDLGMSDLNNQVTGAVGSLATAMSWPTADISTSSSTIEYGIGNANLFVAPFFGDSLTDTATIRSADVRWLTTLRADEHRAGAVDSIIEQPTGLPSTYVTNAVYQVFGMGDLPTMPLEQFTTPLHRMHMWVPGSSRRSSAILRYDHRPGTIIIRDGLMVSGDAGGFVDSITYVDTTGSQPWVRTFEWADTDIDSDVWNVGGFEGNHVWMTAPASPTGNVRWIASTPFDGYMLDRINQVTGAMQSSAGLTNSVFEGTEDLAWAFGYGVTKLSKNVPHVHGYAIGNPNIAIPAWFCTPTVAETCAGDLNGDGTVDAADLSVLLGNWGVWNPASPDTDLTNDGMTDAADLSVLLGGWGTCP